MRGASLTSTTDTRAAVERHTASMKDTLRYVRSRTTARQTDERIRQLAKDALSRDRLKAIEHVVALTIDAARRCDAVEDATMIGEHLVAIARAEWASAHVSPAELSVEEAHMAEERAEADVEVAETALARHPDSMSHMLTYLAAAAKHSRARRELDAAVRRTLAST